MNDLPTPPAPVPEVDPAEPDRLVASTPETSSDFVPAGTGTAGAPDPSVVPEFVVGSPTRPVWSGESDHRPEAGPMYPDLFQQAVAGSHLADVVTVHYADGEPRPGLDVPTSTGHPSDRELVSSSARTPAEVGAFTGASAKKRWKLHR